MASPAGHWGTSPFLSTSNNFIFSSLIWLPTIQVLCSLRDSLRRCQHLTALSISTALATKLLGVKTLLHPALKSAQFSLLATKPGDATVPLNASTWTKNYKLAREDGDDNDGWIWSTTWWKTVKKIVQWRRRLVHGCRLTAVMRLMIEMTKSIHRRQRLTLDLT